MYIFYFLKRPKYTACQSTESFKMSSAKISEADMAIVITSARSASQTVDNSGVSCPSTQCEEL